MIRFNDDDQSYLAWIAAHPRGYVLNIRHEPDPKYVVLHRATCPSISIDRHAEGAFTARSYRKYYAESVEALVTIAQLQGRADGSFSKRCGLCKP
jgi:hypothetical protein